MNRSSVVAVRQTRPITKNAMNISFPSRLIPSLGCFSPLSPFGPLSNLALTGSAIRLCLSRFLACGILALIIAGCASTPKVRYFTLDMESSGQSSPQVNLVVERIRVGEALARKDILIKKSPTEVEYYAAAQWAANLDELVANKLRSEFGPKHDGAVTVVITGELLAFEQVDVPGGAEAHVRLAAMFHRPESASPQDLPFERIYDVRLRAASPAASAVVEALSRCLEQLAAAMAADAAQR